MAAARRGHPNVLVCQQESADYLERGTSTNFSRQGPSTIAKIKEALNFMRNQQFEVFLETLATHAAGKQNTHTHTRHLVQMQDGFA